MKNSRILYRRVVTTMTIAVSLMCSLIVQPTSKATEVKKERVSSRPGSELLRPKVEESYGKLPLSFEPNHGQSRRSVKFVSRGSSYVLLLSATQATLGVGSEQLRMKLENGNSQAVVLPEKQLEGVSNYLIGSDSNKWQTNVPNYARVRVEKVYPDIDLVYYGSDQQRLEFDFIVKPGGDTSKIVMAFEGAHSLRIDSDGNLILKMEKSEIIQPAPVIYQEVDGQRKTVNGRFRVSDSMKVKFEIDEYDRTRDLVIDPKIIYASYHGGSGDERGNDVAVDKTGNAYVVGNTQSTNLNVTGGVQPTNRGGMDAFVVKINPAGTQRIFSTYIGGDGSDFAKAVAIMSDNKVCITGGAEADPEVNVEFPTTSNAYHRRRRLLGNGIDVFVTVLNASGSGFVYSSVFGGYNSDSGSGIAVDATNKIYVTGSALSDDFPTKNEFQQPSDDVAAFIAKFDTSQNGDDSLVYSTVIRGVTESGRTDGQRIAVTPNGIAFSVGTTGSTTLPVKSSASLPPLQSAFKGGTQDIYVAKVSPTGALIYLTYFGGDGLDKPAGIAVDSNERAYISGVTESSAATFPLRNAFDSTRNSSNDGFIAKLNADGTTLFYSTFFSPATGSNEITSMAVDAGGDVYVAGFKTGTTTLAPLNGFQSSLTKANMFIAKIERSNASGTNIPRLLFFDSVSMGGPVGLAVDRKGNLFLGGSTSISTFPTELTNGVYQPNFGGGPNDAFITKVSSTFGDTIGVFRPSTNQFLLRNSNSAGAPDITRLGGLATDLPVAGDWNGDGLGDTGFFRPSTGQFFLKIDLLILGSTKVLNLGQAGDLPVAGDWDGDGVDSVGVFRPATGEWFLTDGPNTDNSTPPIDANFFFGQAGDLPIAGDFNGDGSDGVGVFRPSTGQFFLNNQKLNFAADVILNFGTNGDLPFAGDWIGDGSDGVAVFRPSTGEFFLNSNNIPNFADFIFVFGQNGDMPVAGNWDLNP